MNNPTTSLISFVPAKELQRSLATKATIVAQTALFSELSRINTLYLVARAGSGHLGSSFSAMDIVSWLFLNELKRSDPADPRTISDVYFSSKGHDAPGLYSVMIGLGILPFESIDKLRRLNGLPGHPDVKTIPQVQTNTGSLGMGVSKAHGMVLANRLEGRAQAVYVLTGDGELQEGQFWESLQPAANDKLGEITVIVDHNKLQSDTFVSDVSDLGDLEARFRAHGWEVARCDGHDLDALAGIFAKFKAITDRPKAIIADTKKGSGVSFMEPGAMKNPRLYSFHSGAPDQATYLAALDELVHSANSQLAALGAEPLVLESKERPARVLPDKPNKLIEAYSRALVAAAEKNERIVALDGDLALDCGVLEFEKRFPDRFFECGIAEQDMVSQAGGMALKGLMPIVHSFSCFLSTRPNEQIFNNATEGTKVGYAGSLAGLLPSGPGHSHQCVRDISSVGGIARLVMAEPSCEREVELLFDYCVNRQPENFYLRLVSIPRAIPFQLPSDYQVEKGKGVTLLEGEDAVVFGYGPVLLPEAWHAAKALEKSHGKTIRLVNLPWLNRIDHVWLKETIGSAKKVITLDNHLIAGGQGEKIAAASAQLGLSIQWTPVGLEDVPRCGQNDEILAFYRLDAAGLAARFAEIIVK
ncbi:MAG: transketolase C-terminal domain-containing protein [Terrimicrobiaceae bacterium]